MKYLLAIGIFVLASCKKEVAPAPASEVTVYVVATAEEVDHTGSTNLYWEDSVAHHIPNDDFGVRASGILYANNQLYFEGASSYVDEWMPVYWDNKWVRPNSSDPAGQGWAGSLYVSGNDIYLAGSGPDSNGVYQDGKSCAKFWENGQVTYLSGDTLDSHASAIAVSGSDLYIIWSSYNLNEHYPYQGWLYKNGQSTRLDSKFPYSLPVGLCVSGSDIYILGILYDTLNNKTIYSYWKNGNRTDLNLGDDRMNWLCFTVSEGTVYLAGTIFKSPNTQAAYWKNGEKHILTDGNSIAEVSGIAVVDDDVYVSGTEDGVPTYWKNGKPQRLAHAPTGVVYRTWGIVAVKK